MFGKRYYDMLKVLYAAEDDPTSKLRVEDPSQEVCYRLTKAISALRSATSNKVPLGEGTRGSLDGVWCERKVRVNIVANRSIPYPELWSWGRRPCITHVSDMSMYMLIYTCVNMIMSIRG